MASAVGDALLQARIGLKKNGPLHADNYWDTSCMKDVEASFQPSHDYSTGPYLNADWPRTLNRSGCGDTANKLLGQ